MCMNGQLRVPPEFDDSDEADRIQARHHACAAARENEVVAAAHLVEIAGEIEGEHHYLAGSLRMSVDDRYDGVHPIFETTIRSVGLQFVVLDEIDAGFTESRNKVRRFFRSEADGRFNDRADQRTPL